MRAAGRLGDVVVMGLSGPCCRKFIQYSCGLRVLANHISQNYFLRVYSANLVS